MTIGFNETAFLKYCSKNRSFGKTATLGRQRIATSKYINQIVKYPRDYDFGKWADQLLIEVFNSTNIDVYDYSNFEGANKILDFGPGVGRILPAYYKKNKITGYDISSNYKKRLIT